MPRMWWGGVCALLCASLCWQCRAGDAGADAAAWVNPWRTEEGDIRDGSLMVRSVVAYASLVGDGLGRHWEEGESVRAATAEEVGAVVAVDCPPFAATAGWKATATDGTSRRADRLAAVRNRMLNGPEAMLAFEPFSTGTQRGIRMLQGAVAPLNSRLEAAALNRIGLYRRKHDGAAAGIEALSLRLGAGPAAACRPWLAATPYVGLGSSDAIGLGLSGGVEKRWSGGGEFAVSGYAFEAWDEGFETVVHDGRRHGFGVSGSLPVGERLRLSASAGYEWLELGPHAPGGAAYAGKRGEWMLRGEYALFRREGAETGCGFRDAGLWREEPVSTALSLYADLYGRRYIGPEGFSALELVERSFRQRVGVLYSQAISSRLGLGVEAYAGQDTGRGVSAGELYGASICLNAVVSPRLRLYVGWRHDASTDSLLGGGGPERFFFLGLHGKF